MDIGIRYIQLVGNLNCCLIEVAHFLKENVDSKIRILLCRLNKVELIVAISTADRAVPFPCFEIQGNMSSVLKDGMIYNPFT